MKAQSYCGLTCRHWKPHTHPAIPASLAPKLAELANRDGMAYREVLARMSLIVRNRVRRYPDARQWTEANGTVDADPLTDKTLNPRRVARAAPYYVAWTLLTVEVLKQCEQDTLQQALHSSESSYLPIL